MFTGITTRITQMLKIQYPILQGGLAYLAVSDLAAAVANAGGLGQITATSLRGADDLRREIAAVRGLTDKPFGVNIAVSQHRSVEEFVDVVLDEGVLAVTLTGGNPAPALQRLTGSGIKTLVMISSVIQAKKAEHLGADAVIAVGQEGGGHIGRDDTGTFVLIPAVVDAVKIPVIASGGIADGRGLAAALALGAEGIEMGTRFVATTECAAHHDYKERLTQATPADTRVIKRSLGAPGRVLDGLWTRHIVDTESSGAPTEELHKLLTGERNKTAVFHGDFEQGFAWAGQSVALIHSVKTVQDVINETVQEALLGQRRLAALFEREEI